jgi:hypothetical protein
MKKNWRMWCGLVISSIVLGAVETGFRCCQQHCIGAQAFTTQDLIRLFLIYSIISVAALLLLRMVYKLLRRFLPVWASFLALAAFFYAEEDLRGLYALEKFEHEWEAKGEKFDFASFIPPPVPDDQNFALTPVVARCYSYLLDKNGRRMPEGTKNVSRLEMLIWHNYECDNTPTNWAWERGQFTDLKAWQEYYRSPRPQYRGKFTETNEFKIASRAQSPGEDGLLALSKYDVTIEELRQAAQLPFSRFPLNYDSKELDYLLLPQLAALRRCTGVLNLRAAAELDLGKTEQALRDVKLALRLADSTHGEPFLILLEIRCAMLCDALQPVADGLAKHQWTDAELVQLGEDLGKLDFLADLQFALRGERAAMMGTIEGFRCPRDYQIYAMYPDEFFEWNSGTIAGAAIFHLMPSGWFYQLELAIAKTNQLWTLGVVDPATHLAYPKHKISIGNTRYEVRPWPLWLADVLTLADENPERRIVYIQEAVDMARVACALERYRLALGEYPEILADLAPRFIGVVPHDIIGGEPLHYRRVANGSFALYSVGWNEKDDGGQFFQMSKYGDREEDFATGNWVWPAPEK